MRDQQPSRRRLQPDALASMLLVLSWAFFFSDPLFTAKNLYFRDILQFHYPLRKVLVESYARGEWPLWNPFVYLGQPMLANPNYMALYPTNLFHLVFPFDYAFKLHFILHPLVGGLGLYFLQRRLGIEAVAALGGSLVYQYSGAVLSFLNLYNLVPIVALLPCVGWSFVAALEGRRWWRRCLFGAVLALQIVSIEPLLAQCTFWLLFGLALLHWLQSGERRDAAGEIGKTAIFGLFLGVGLAAVQVLPSLELLMHSHRTAGFDFEMHSKWSLHPLDLLNLVIPNLFGNPYSINRIFYWGETFHSGREGFLVSFFIGAAAALMVLLSFASCRRRLACVFFGIAIVGTSLALGQSNPIYHWLFEKVPVLRLGRYPSKYFLLTTLALSVLVSLGIEAFLRHGENNRRARIQKIIVGLGGITLAALFVGFWVHWQNRPDALLNWIRSGIEPRLLSRKDLSAVTAQVLAALRQSGLFLAIAGGLILASAIWRRTALLAATLILLMVAELTSQNLSLTPLISEADVDFVPAVNEYLRPGSGSQPQRVVNLDSPAFLPIRLLRAPSRSAAWYTLYQRRSGQPLYGIAQGLQYSIYYSIDDLNTIESDVLLAAALERPWETRIPLLARLNSATLLSMEDLPGYRVRAIRSFDTHSDVMLKAYQIDGALPRAFLVSGVEHVDTPAQALARLVTPSFPVDRFVILEDPQVAVRPAEGDPGAVQILDYRSREVLCQVQARVTGYVVLLDSYYPGWRAKVDGRAVPLLRANYAFRAVEVPAGNHRVEFSYQPLSFYAGLCISCLTVLGAAVVIFLNSGRRGRIG